MRPSLTEVKNMVAECNRKYFDSTLPFIPVAISNARSYVGQITCLKMSTRNGGGYKNFKLTISTRFDLPREVIEDVIIHELIHYELMLSGKADSTSHGSNFRTRMREINRRFGRNVTLSQKLTAKELQTDISPIRSYICLSTFKDGDLGVTRVASTRVYDMWDKMARIANVVKTEWVFTRDPWFNKFPRSLNPKIYRPESNEILLMHLNNARRMVKHGGRIMFGDYFIYTAPK